MKKWTSLDYDEKKIEKDLFKKYSKFGNYVLWHPHKTIVTSHGSKVTPNQIKETEFEQSYKYQFSLAHFLIDQNKIEELVHTFKFWVSKELFKGHKKYTNILESEINLFLNEIMNKHTYASAIMIGRTLEFLSISISEILGIKAETSYFADLEQLKNKFTIMNDHAMSFEEAIISNDKNKVIHLKRKISELSVEISTKLQKFVSLIEYDKYNKTISPEKRYLDRMLKEIRKKYQKVEGVEHIYKRIEKHAYIKKITSIRNKAAHAPSKNSNNKIYQKDINEMLHNFISLVEELMAIYLLIKNEKKYFQVYHSGKMKKISLPKNMNVGIGPKLKKT